jgi:hypothetical protein
MSDEDSKDKNKDTAVSEQGAIAGNETVEQTALEKEQAKAAKDLSKDKGASGLTMHVRVAAPFREYFDGQAFSVSATNLTGPFDILPQHHSFISLLTACDMEIRGLVDGEQKVIKISISGGIMHVKEDEVIVFLDV